MIDLFIGRRMVFKCMQYLEPISMLPASGNKGKH